MDYFLTISDEASAHIKSTIEYLKREWSQRSVVNFQNDLLNCFDQIISNPLSFLLIDAEHGIRKRKVSKSERLFAAAFINNISQLSFRKITKSASYESAILFIIGSISFFLSFLIIITFIPNKKLSKLYNNEKILFNYLYKRLFYQLN